MEEMQMISTVMRIAEKVKRIPRNRREAAAQQNLERTDLWMHPLAENNGKNTAYETAYNRDVVKLTLLLARDKGLAAGMKQYENMRSSFDSVTELRAMKMRDAAGPR